MKIFLDSADPIEIEMVMKKLNITGITTNPKLSTTENAFKIAKRFQIPTSIQIEYSSVSDAINKAKLVNSRWSVIKLAVSDLEIARDLIQIGFKVNLTLCFSLYQVICAANLRADYVSIFVGRLEDQGINAGELIKKSAEYISKTNSRTKIIAASIRNIEQFEVSASMGANIATVSPKLLLEYRNKATEKGIIDFFENKIIN